MLVYTCFNTSFYVYLLWYLSGIFTHIVYFVFFCAIRVCEGGLRRKETTMGLWSTFEAFLWGIWANTRPKISTWACVPISGSFRDTPQRVQGQLHGRAPACVWFSEEILAIWKAKKLNTLSHGYNRVTVAILGQYTGISHGHVDPWFLDLKVHSYDFEWSFSTSLRVQSS